MRIDVDKCLERKREGTARKVQHDLLLATAAAVSFFFAFSLLYTQVYNSDDDFFMLYTLAGGYGNKPTHILHYANGWNPFLFWPVSKLFALEPHFNWYSLLLLVLQLIATINLAYTLLNIFTKLIALVILTIFFLFFGSYLFQSLNVSNTSLILAISGCTSLLTVFLQSPRQTAFRFQKLIIPFLLLIISCMLRMHTFVFYAFLIVVSGLVMLPKREIRSLIIAFSILGAVLFGITLLHDLYYKKIIPYSEAREKRRGSFFYIANHPLLSNDQDTGTTKIKNSLIRSWFIADTAFLKQSDVDYFIKKYKTDRMVIADQSSKSIFWMFVNGRIYFVFTGLLVLVFILLKAYKPLKQWLILFLMVAAIFSALILFLKITVWIFIGLFSFLFLSAALALRNEQMKLNTQTYFALALLFLITAWAIKLIHSSDAKVQKSTLRTTALLNQIQRHPKALFISTVGFDDNGFYIWNTPSQYPLENLIHKEQFLTDSYQHTLTRFQITDLVKSLPTDPNVYLLGNIMPFYKEYYQVKFGWRVEREKPDAFQHFEVYRLNRID